MGADEPFETILTIYAESQEMAGLRTYKTITVKPLDFEDIPSVTAGSTTTVTIDGVEWYVLVKDNREGAALGERHSWNSKSLIIQHLMHGRIVQFKNIFERRLG
ncbi:MAG: hypothetical protein ACLR23_05485 [Clostridia bacterium]